MEPPSDAPSQHHNVQSLTTEDTEGKQRGLEIDDITRIAIGCAFKVHTALGPGLVESAYPRCLEHQIAKAGLLVESEVPLAIVYNGLRIERAFRVDLRVEKRV